MHIYVGQMYPLKLTTDIWNTPTPQKFHIYQNAQICMSDVTPPINHKYMEYHYTESVSHIAEYTYTKANPSSN